MVTDEKEQGLQYNAGEAIGDYCCTFNKTSRFIYKSRELCEGYQIRRKNWQEVLDTNDFIGKALRNKIQERHYRLESILARQKNVQIKKLMGHAHVDQLKYLRNQERNDKILEIDVAMAFGAELNIKERGGALGDETINEGD